MKRWIFGPLAMIALVPVGCREQAPTVTSIPARASAMPPVASAAPSASASLQTIASAAPAGPVDNRASIKLSFRKSAYFLGENALLDFCVVNETKSPISISVGGDYRGSTRSLRFKLEVRDATGQLMADPDPNPFNMGGLGYSPQIEPGKPWCASLQLGRYARIDAAGTYTIRATHDLGWAAGTAPWGETTIALKMPSAAEAEHVIDAMNALPRDPNSSAGSASIDWADFSALRYDVYTAPLLARAQKGNADAITGLANIPTPAATHALVSLLSSTDHAVVRGAADGLSFRLPDPALNGALGPRNVFANEMTDERKYLSRAWTPDSTDAVKSAARSFLASTDTMDVERGGFFLEAIGTPAEAPDLTRALTTAIDHTQTAPRETDVYPVPRGACQELLRAADILTMRGATQNSPKSSGEIAMWLVGLSAGARPQDWQGELGRDFAHPIPFVRSLAMSRAPAPLPPQLVPLVAANLAHADIDVEIAADELAQREKLTALGKGVVAQIPHATGMHINIANNAAYELGQRYFAALALAGHLKDADTFNDVLRELLGLLDEHGSSGNGEITQAIRDRLVKRWTAFILQHKEQISGKPADKLSLDDPTVTPDLLPPEWTLNKKDGSEWPRRK